MKDISEYNSGMAEYEFFSYLYDKVLAREITSFSDLKEIVSEALRDKWTHPVIMKIFLLLKRLNWGFFSGISPGTHKKLWKEMVIADRDFPEAGDLKKNLQISNLYVAMLDIHGYTNFCMESRKNLSMMHTLDWAIENEIKRISNQCGVICQRERGDEMVIVAASAVDVLMAVLCILDYFGKTNVVGDPSISTTRSKNAKALPRFKISCGITGGNTQSPLIITERGCLAGFLLNSGARLQSRANEMSPKESRIMIAKQVMMNYEKENAASRCILDKYNSIYFLDTGHIEFKGVLIPACEVIFNKNERYREKLAQDMIKLFSSIRENLWEIRIYQDLMDLLIKAAQTMPDFSVTLKHSVNGAQTITNDSFIQVCRQAIKAYCADEDYHTAVNSLHHLTAICKEVRSFDRLIFDYLKGIAAKYQLILDAFKAHIDREVEEKAELIFGDHHKTWTAAKNSVQVHEKMRGIGRKSKEITNKKKLWLNMLLEHKDKMEFTLYSGKK